MQHLYSPWRANYYEEKVKIEDCIFCHICKSFEDDKNLVVFRSQNFYVVMNLYPYNIGEIMINPNRHIKDYEDLSEVELIELSKLIKVGILTLKKARNAQGVNVGFNLGEIAGAGIAEHLHCHLVPRYFGDTNFITTIGDTRVMGVDFTQTLHSLRQSFKEIYEHNM